MYAYIFNLSACHLYDKMLESRISNPFSALRVTFEYCASTADDHWNSCSHMAQSMDSCPPLSISITRWDYLHNYIGTWLSFYYQKFKNGTLDLDGKERPVVLCRGPIWFSYLNTALPWHYPIGLLYDLLVNDINNRFNIRVHSHECPKPGLFIGSQYIDELHDLILEDAFLSQCRQAEYLYKGKTSTSHNTLKMLEWTRRDVRLYWERLWNMGEIYGTSDLPLPYLKDMSCSESTDEILLDSSGVFLPFRIYVVLDSEKDPLGIQISCLFPPVYEERVMDLKSFVSCILDQECGQLKNVNFASDIIIHGRVNDERLLRETPWTVYNQCAFPTFFLCIVVKIRKLNFEPDRGN
jgi:hypothetical protein